MRVVLDTNVVVSAMLSPNGASAAILRAVLDGRLCLLVDNRIVFEYSDVLCRPTFRFDTSDVRAFLDFVEHEAEYVNALPTDAPFDDPDDRPFYEVALSGDADCLVTGNTRHFPEHPVVGAPTQFLARISAGQ